MARRRQHSGEFKAKVVVQALKGAKTVNEIASTYGVHPVQVAQWPWRISPINSSRPPSGPEPTHC